MKLFAWYRKYKRMAEEIRNTYGDLSFENYCKYKSKKNL